MNNLEKRIQEYRKVPVFSQQLGQINTLLHLIHDNIDITEPFTFLEVGVCEGRNPVILTKEFENIIYIGVDPYQKYNAGIPEERLKKFEVFADERISKIPNATLYKEKSEDVVDRYPDNSLDMVFIDGDHRYAEVMKDCTMWYPKAKKVLAMHDYKELKQTTQAIDDFVEQNNLILKNDFQTKVGYIIKE